MCFYPKFLQKISTYRIPKIDNIVKEWMQQMYTQYSFYYCFLLWAFIESNELFSINLQFDDFLNFAPYLDFGFMISKVMRDISDQSGYDLIC